jgi:hypothetical protein
MPLRAITDDGDFLALDDAEITIAVVTRVLLRGVEKPIM